MAKVTGDQGPNICPPPAFHFLSLTSDVSMFPSAGQAILFASVLITFIPEVFRDANRSSDNAFTTHFIIAEVS